MGRRRQNTEKGLLSFLGTAVSVAVFVLVLGLAVLTILLPALVGGRPLTVLTQSMEPGLPPGTLVVIRPTPIDQIRVGDVLTYQIESGRPDVVTHRVVSRETSSDGSTSFLTKGDNNDVVDELPVREVQVVGTLWYSIPWLGHLNSLINGELRSLVLPVVVAALFVYGGFQVFAGVRARVRSRRRAGPDAVTWAPTPHSRRPRRRKRRTSKRVLSSPPSGSPEGSPGTSARIHPSGTASQPSPSAAAREHFSGPA